MVYCYSKHDWCFAILLYHFYFVNFGENAPKSEKCNDPKGQSDESNV